MSVRPADRGAALLAAALAAGCHPPGQLLTSVTEAWGEQTAGVASPAVTATLVMGGLAARLCMQDDAAAWRDLAAGDLPPIHPALLAALGEPVVDAVEVSGSGALVVELSGATLFDREDARVRFATAPSTSGFGFEATVLDARAADTGTVAADPFGMLAFDVQADCAPGRNRVEGTSQWTELDGRSHRVTLPADAELSAGVGFDNELPYLPVAGTAAWSGRVDGADRSLATYDAAEVAILEEDGGDTGAAARRPAPPDTGGADTGGDTGLPDFSGELVRARWLGQAGGNGWTAQVSVLVAP